MAVEIIPAILEKNFENIKIKIQEIEPYVLWAQIDVVDGIFAPNVTWNNPAELKMLNTSLHLEIDLMISEPEKHIDAWIASGAARIFFHVEATENPKAIIQNIHEAGIQAGISINPSTAVDILYEFVSHVDAVLFLGVEPGFQGQTFHEDTIEKVKNMRAKFPEIAIEVDGGVRPGMARKLAEAGVTRIVAGSAIFEDGALAVNKKIEDLLHDTKLN